MLCDTALMENYLNGFCHVKVELLLEILGLDFEFISLNAWRQLFVPRGTALVEKYLKRFSRGKVKVLLGSTCI